MANNIITQHPPDTTLRSPLFEWVKRHSLAAFFLLTFGYSGLLMFPVLASSLGWLPFHIAVLPALLIQLLAVWGPTLSAFLLTGLISGKEIIMETLPILVILFIVLVIASLRWGVDSTEKLDGPEWRRRATWSAHLAGPDRDNAERKQMLTWSQSPHH